MRFIDLSRYSVLLFGLLIPWAVSVAADLEEVNKWPIFDAHIHYTRDSWQDVPPEEAIRRLKAVGVTRALVSSTTDEGTIRLHQLDPEFIIPAMRPYRNLGTLDTWMYDESVIPYMREQMEKYKFAAIGEFHIEGEQAYLPVVREAIRLAKEYDVILHVHSDLQAIEFIYEQYPKARIIWAHGGFDYAVRIGKMLKKHKRLWVDLSFRGEIINNMRLMKAWEILLKKYPDRFMLGLDPYQPKRWREVNLETAMKWQRELMAVLPEKVARKIAYENGEKLFKFYTKK